MSLEADAAGERTDDTGGEDLLDATEAEPFSRCLTCQRRAVTVRTVCEHPTCGHLALSTAFWDVPGPTCPGCDQLEDGSALAIVSRLYHCEACGETFDREPGTASR